jgi:hypothetical protein
MNAAWSATDEIRALRLLLNGDRWYEEPFDGELISLGNLIYKGLTPGRGVVPKRDMKLFILAAVTGIKQLSPLNNPDASSKLITRHTAQVLIDYLQEGDSGELSYQGARLVKYLERMVTDQVVEASWELAGMEEGLDDQTRRIVFGLRRRKAKPDQVRADGRAGDDHDAGVGANLPDLQPAGEVSGPARGDPDPW